MFNQEIKTAGEYPHKDIPELEELEKPEAGIEKDTNNQAGYVAVIRNKINYRYNPSDNIGTGGQKNKI